jgi:GT2 family glycosyltransferase/glycosyltransferase involved in cell wall biosynthesis
MQVSVIIPVYNALPLAKECVASIFSAGSKLIFEVIVVDNGSSPEVEEWLLREEESRTNLRHLRYSEALGFSRAVNAGAASAAGEVLIILNSDTMVTPGWMDGLYLALTADPSLGAVSPYTNRAGSSELMDFRTTDLPRSKALALVRAKPRPPCVRYLPQKITFFCVAIRHALWRDLGGLSESYGVGNFEDDDLCLRLRVAGLRLGVAEHVFVYHEGKATFHANNLDHSMSLMQNAAIFATHAREFAEAPDPSVPRWPKRSAADISVVILPKAGAPLDRTLRSLRNQTVRDFEILPPDRAATPSGTWVAYVTAGDILYPFHLETLQDAIQRSSGEAIFSDGWIRDATGLFSHPDSARFEHPSEPRVSNPQFPHAPITLAGWMHHRSIDPNRLWEQTAPFHWPHLTWEMLETPVGLETETHLKPAWSLNRAVVESAREVYRRAVPFETRLSIDSGIRKILGLQSSPSLSGSSNPRNHADERSLHLAAVVDSRTDAGKFSIDSSLPDVFFFNIIPWNSLTQRPHHFARGLAERGHRVFWIEVGFRFDKNWWTGRPFEQVRPNIHLVQLPGMEQPTGSRDIYQLRWDTDVLEIMARAFDQIASAYGSRQAISLVHFPRWEPLVTHLRNRFGWKVIYDCLDDQHAFAKLYHTLLRDHETRLIELAAGLVTSSAVLQKRLFGGRPSILLHNAADYELFSSAISPGYLRHLSRPIVGFFGAFADWLDMDLIRAAAAQLPDWSFVYIGQQSFSCLEVETKWLRATRAANITVFPRMDPGTLAMFLAEFDVCTVPFLDVPATRTMNAVKIYEYLAAGKPVVSRDLPEVRHLVAGEPDARDLLALYSRPEEFVTQLRAVFSSDNPDRVRQRQNFALRHQWCDRVDVLAREIARVSEQVAYDTSSMSASSKGSKTRSQE